MATERTFLVTHLPTGETRELRLPITGIRPRKWSLGARGSGADAELDDAQLAGLQLWIEELGNHRFLTTDTASSGRIPGLAVCHPGRQPDLEADGWTWLDGYSEHAGSFEQTNRLRFDRYPVRVGEHAIQVSHGPTPPWRPPHEDWDPDDEGFDDS